MIPSASVRHQIPGRLRIKVASRKGDIAYFEAMSQAFTACEGIESLETNAVTGSVLFRHRTDGRSIGTFAEGRGLFRLSGAAESPVRLQERITAAFGGLDDQIKSFTGGEIDAAALTTVALIGAGVYQLARGNAAALPWYGAFWYGLNILLKSSHKSS